MRRGTYQNIINFQKNKFQENLGNFHEKYKNLNYDYFK